jgi:hypothetical protein
MGPLAHPASDSSEIKVGVLLPVKPQWLSCAEGVIPHAHYTVPHTEQRADPVLKIPTQAYRPALAASPRLKPRCPEHRRWTSDRSADAVGELWNVVRELSDLV